MPLGTLIAAVLLFLIQKLPSAFFSFYAQTVPNLLQG